MLSEEDEDPLHFENLTYVRDARISKMLNSSKETCIIISASGMCEGGRILHHLKHNISDPKTTILFTGYQAPHTLGRLILDRAKEIIKIYGEPYELKAQVCKLESSSGHADQQQLLDWAREMKASGKLKKVVLVHCELESAEEFKNELGEIGIENVLIPARGSKMQLN